MARKPLTVGVIGLGYGRAHIPAFQANGCDVVAVCQRDEAAAKKVAERYGVPQVYARWEELLERARPAIVVIAAPPALHKPIALQAFAGGAHVLCEKPLALSIEDCDEIIAARGDRVVQCGYMKLHDPAVQRMVELLRSGDMEGKAGATRMLYKVRGVAAERVFAELKRIVAGDRPVAGLELMDDLGLTAVVLPELGALRGVESGAHPLAGLSRCVGDSLKRIRSENKPDIGTVRVRLQVTFRQR